MSKWMIYQGIIGLSKTSPLWIIWLLAAMFGSALTLASFIKIIHAAFLGQGSEETENVKEVSWQMWLPLAVLAALCILFGLFAYGLPLSYLVLPVISGLSYDGFWNPLLATCLILVALIFGFFIYYLKNQVEQPVSKAIYVGGEIFEEKTIKVSGIDFYNNVKEMGPLPGWYRMAEKRNFDLYEIAKNLSLKLSQFLSWMHNGLLHTYLAWLFLGMIILFFVLR
jgi:NADH:ubiquinone oxidoreductase subunit 5 (subunit L)/multisubunit Na+/H+ antiporter MnhA subunit